MFKKIETTKGQRMNSKYNSFVHTFHNNATMSWADILQSTTKS